MRRPKESDWVESGICLAIVWLSVDSIGLMLWIQAQSFDSTNVLDVGRLGTHISTGYERSISIARENS